MTKAVRRKQTVDDAFIEQLYTDTQALYHLGGSAPAGDKADLGPLPATARVLLGALAAAWVGIGLYVCIRWAKSSKTVTKARKNGANG